MNTDRRIYKRIVRPDYTPEMLSFLKEDEIFVFGSNLEGRHGGGAARAARIRFGAIMGQGVGLQGQSYAIPTMQGGVETIKPYVDEFIEFARSHSELFFYVTRIGCGIAGFTEEQIAPLFAEAIYVPNICLPESFAKLIQPKVPEEIRTIMYGQMRTLVDLLKTLNQESPITDADDAEDRLTHLVRRNVRYGDAYAFLAIRVLWELISRHNNNREPVHIEKLEDDIMEYFNDSCWMNDNPITQVLYRYSAEKMIRYIQFLNEFRRYTDFNQIGDDMLSIGFSHCSSNEPDYYYSFNPMYIHSLFKTISSEWHNISRSGRLDNEALEDLMFGRYERMISAQGLRETINLAYQDMEGHPGIKEPKYSYKAIHGPYFKVKGNNIERGCSDFRRWPWSNTQFEMQFAREILIKDEKYIRVTPDEYNEYFIPRNDYSLPVYSLMGKMHFDSEEDKIRFIQDKKRC